MKKTTKSTLNTKLDKLCSGIVRSKGRCQKCGKSYNLQCAHIFSRSLRSVRWDMDNLLCLCSACHLFFAHKNPIEFTEWVKSYLGKDKYESLRIRARQIKKWEIWELEELLYKLKDIYGLD